MYNGTLVAITSHVRGGVGVALDICCLLVFASTLNGTVGQVLGE
jgi:hypothetical protein